MGFILVTGGVRSGKSEFAERLCDHLSDRVTYLATGVAIDSEMDERIDMHKKRRPTTWITKEEPLHLTWTIAEIPSDDLIFIDSLTTWVANWLSEELLDPLQEKEKRAKFLEKIEKETEELLQDLEHRYAVVVTDEVGLGGIAFDPLTRLFQDALGLVNQRMAAKADEVWFVVSGIPLRVKG